MRLKKILIVEDEEVIRRLCERILKPMGHELILAGTLGEGFEKIKNDAFDLLISDLRLPDGHGSKIINYFRERFPDHKVIIITGSPTPEDSHDFIFNFESIECIYKPFEKEKLMAAVCRALGDLKGGD